MQDTLRFSDLPDYAFPRLRTLLEHIKAPSAEIAMHIGEPTHAFPPFIKEKILENIAGFNSYPPNDGTLGLLSAITNWISNRYNVPLLDHRTNVISLNGTREGLFNATIALSPRKKNGECPLTTFDKNVVDYSFGGRIDWGWMYMLFGMVALVKIIYVYHKVAKTN